MYVTLAVNPFGPEPTVPHVTFTHDNGGETQEPVDSKAMRTLQAALPLRAGQMPIDYAEIMDDGTFVIRWKIEWLEFEKSQG